MPTNTSLRAEPEPACVSKVAGENGNANHDRSAIDVIVDCDNPASSDLLALWLSQAGYPVGTGPAGVAAERPAQFRRPTIAITDRFDPCRGPGATLSALRLEYDASVVVVVGRGGRTDAEVLALARVSGADATISMPLIRQDVVAVIDRLGCAPALR